MTTTAISAKYAMIGITVINIPTINPFLPISGDLSFTPRYITIPPNIEKNIGTKYHALLGVSCCDIIEVKLFEIYKLIYSSNFFFFFSVWIFANSNSSLVCLNFFNYQHLMVNPITSHGALLFTKFEISNLSIASSNNLSAIALPCSNVIVFI